jgi:hypothetical protein
MKKILFITLLSTTLISCPKNKTTTELLAEEWYLNLEHSIEQWLYAIECSFYEPNWQ